jgi:hypothetical protein
MYTRHVETPSRSSRARSSQGPSASHLTRSRQTPEAHSSGMERIMQLPIKECNLFHSLSLNAVRKDQLDAAKVVHTAPYAQNRPSYSRRTQVLSQSPPRLIVVWGWIPAKASHQKHKSLARNPKFMKRTHHK